MLVMSPGNSAHLQCRFVKLSQATSLQHFPGCLQMIVLTSELSRQCVAGTGVTRFFLMYADSRCGDPIGSPPWGGRPSCQT